MKKKIHTSAHPTAFFSFTTCENAYPLLSKKFALTALIFMRKAKAPVASKHLAPQRSSAPLFASLHPILALLSTGPEALTILSVQNVSSMYVEELANSVERLEYDAETRRAYSKKVGVQRWREERLYRSLEAALLKEGMITKWAILLGKN